MGEVSRNEIERGLIALRVSLSGTAVDTRHDANERVVDRGPLDVVHDQSLLVGEVRVAAEVGMAAGLALTALVPVRMIDTGIRYLDAAGNEVMLVEPGIHHRNEVVAGLVDPFLMVRGARRLGAWSVSARAGLSLPLGTTEEDPFALGDAGLAHQHIQTGTGTFNPVLGLEARHTFDGWSLGGFALTQQIFYENGKGYQAGDRYAAGVVAESGLGLERWHFRAGAELQAESAERWHGMVYTDDGNRGRIDVLAALGGGVSVGNGVGLEWALKVPVYTHVIGGQLDFPAVVEVGASWSFGGPGPRPRSAEHEEEDGHEHGHEHDHGDEHGHDDHEHGDEPAGQGTPGSAAPAAPGAPAAPAAHDLWAGLDAAAYGEPGAAVDLVPVAGKVTIFDFWAVWCKPCKELDRRLAELARRHPDRVAVRRIDVVDWDSAVVARYLSPGGFDMPHLKVFDAAGALVIEASGSPDELLSALEAVLAR